MRRGNYITTKEERRYSYQVYKLGKIYKKGFLDTYYFISHDNHVIIVPREELLKDFAEIPKLKALLLWHNKYRGR
jgi:hypothetical protein